MRKLLLICVVCLALASIGCYMQSPFKEFYHHEAGVSITHGNATNPQVSELPENANIKAERARLSREGYVCFGRSTFEGCGNWKNVAAEDQAKLLGADVAIWQKVPATKKGRYYYTAYYFAKKARR